ncbi:hypothetical protein D3C78_1098690 [compost metagenome]
MVHFRAVIDKDDLPVSAGNGMRFLGARQFSHIAFVQWAGHGIHRTDIRPVNQLAFLIFQPCPGALVKIGHLRGDIGKVVQ